MKLTNDVFFSYRKFNGRQISYPCCALTVLPRRKRIISLIIMLNSSAVRYRLRYPSMFVLSVTWADLGYAYYPLLGEHKERLLIESARLLDAGKFQCIGKSRLGSASRTTILTVNG